MPPITETNQRDISSGVSETIEYEHHETHGARHFIFEEGFQLNDATRYYIIETADTPREPHMTLAIDGAQDSYVQLLENVSYRGQTEQTVCNRHRRSRITSETRIYEGRTGVLGAASLQLFSAQWGVPAAGGGRGASGGSGAGRHEFILERNMRYQLTVTALSGNANNFTVIMDHYEHLPRTLAAYLEAIVATARNILALNS